MRWIVLVALSVLTACSSNDDAASASGPQALDPTKVHYGKSHAEWGSDWWRWVFEFPGGDATNCKNPLLDNTGELCAERQPTSAPVFFLAGTGGSAVERTKCVVPAGKALFFPIINSMSDNAGLPPEKLQTLAEMEASLKGQMDGVVKEDLVVTVDGKALTGLDKHRVGPARFDYTVPPEPNAYTCFGAPGITGKVEPAMHEGFFVMLAPLPAGPHTITFAARAKRSPEDFRLSVTYRLTVK